MPAAVHRLETIVAAVLLGCSIGCDAPPAPADRSGVAAGVTPEPGIAAEPGPPTVKLDETLARPSEARAGEGPLALGVVALQISTVAEDATITCEICRHDRGPKLVVLGALDDPSWSSALQDLDAIAGFYADDGLGAFVVLGERAGEQLRAPGDPTAVRGRVDELRAALRLGSPVLVAARGELGFDEYRIAKSPTVLLLDGKGTVLWSGIAERSWGELDAAITRALAPSG
jgi:hypothetical protein